MRYDRLKQWIDFLHNLPDEKFDYDLWVSETDGHACGTVCCAAGWLPAVDPENWQWQDDWRANDLLMPRLKEVPSMTTVSAVAKYLEVEPNGYYYELFDAVLRGFAFKDYSPSRKHVILALIDIYNSDVPDYFDGNMPSYPKEHLDKRLTHPQAFTLYDKD